MIYFSDISATAQHIDYGHTFTMNRFVIFYLIKKFLQQIEVRNWQSMNVDPRNK